MNLEPIVQKALNLSHTVSDFIKKLILFDFVLGYYSEKIFDAVSLLKSGNKAVRIGVQTKILSTNVHWVSFRANTVEYDREGNPQIVVFPAQMIDDEIALKARIRFEHEQTNDSRKDLIGYVSSNITKNVFAESKKVLDGGPLTPTGS